MTYEQFQHISVENRDGVGLLTINRPDKLNAANARLHWELGRIWPVIGDDPAIRVAVVTGAGRAFCVGGDNDLVENTIGNPEAIYALHQEARDIVHNMINLDKPVLSAINGHAFGSGLAVALMADISVAATNARLWDGHVALGVAAGDHAAAIWPLLCGMAKAKLYLMTGKPLDGAEAERIGLVSMAVEPDKVLSTTLAIAEEMANGATFAQRFTKQALNQWLRMGAHTSFETSAALEMLTFMGGDVKEGLRAVQERRAPNFRQADKSDDR